ncbi:MAG: RNA polymerase sigma factor [Tannerellaceae bacterium]|nr:RNA polymerase sigma factor [Tannerellaceae bacterium]
MNIISSHTTMDEQRGDNFLRELFRNTLSRKLQWEVYTAPYDLERLENNYLTLNGNLYSIVLQGQAMRIVRLRDFYMEVDLVRLEVYDSETLKQQYVYPNKNVLNDLYKAVDELYQETQPVDEPEQEVLASPVVEDKEVTAEASGSNLFNYLYITSKETDSSLEDRLVDMREVMQGFANKLTRNKGDAEDLLQETMLRVLENREKLAEGGDWKRWVLKIMNYVFLNNSFKIRRSYSILDSDVDFVDLDNVLAENRYLADANYTVKNIHEAIERLEPELKIPFTMFMSGYKYREIADQLKIPLGAVKSRIFFARQELQKYLKDYKF